MLKNLLLTCNALLIAFAVNAQCLTISCNSNITVNNDSGLCGTNVMYTTPTVVSNTCAGIDSDTFSFTGAMQTWVVPVGITSVTIQTWGAQGGANWINNNNFGGYVSADIAVTPGSTLYIFVGGQATTIAGGFNGGGNGEGAGKGGGGATDVRIGGTTYNDRVVVAGGGGGAGYWSSLHVVGGQGGGLTGTNGYRDPSYAANPGGVGGTQTSSGNGTCVSLNNPAVAGGFGYGGAPSGCGCEGYGGGGGWWGGAGSGNCRGGGGGSGYAIPAATNVVMNTGVRTGNGMAIISYAGASAATVNQTAGLPSGSFFPAGTTTNTFIATDQFGNSDTCTFDVVVNDTEIPVLSNVPLNITMNADSAMCSTIVSWTPPTMSDNCTVVLNSNFAPGASFPVGTTTVTYTATDTQGNADTATFTVTVVDTQVPWWTWMPTDTTVNNDAGQCSAIVTWAPAAAADNCSIDTMFSSANSGDAFPVGVTVVTYVVIDGSGNTDTATFTITVLDNEMPTVTCPIDITVNADSGNCSASGVSLGSVTVMDNCATTSANDAPSVFPVGVTVVTHTVTDAGGNTVTCQQNVTVVDDQAPGILNCSSDLITCEGTVVMFNTPMAMDNCGATISQVSGPNSGDTLGAGMYTVVFVAADSSGNTDTCSFNITVTADPVVTASASVMTPCADDADVVLTGSPAGGMFFGTSVSGNQFDPSVGAGAYAIIYSFTDVNGCVGSDTININVNACVGITESGAPSFMMFPNPASELFTFQSADAGTLVISDAQGKQVYNLQVKAGSTEINVSELAAGAYAVQFASDGGMVSNGKLIIQR